MNDEEYPLEMQLRSIRRWPFEQGAMDWFLLVRDAWHWPEWGVRITQRSVYLATGGWSGNEAIVQAMSENRIMWSLCWRSSRTGGGHVFRIWRNRS